jgi:hypothetical protein
MAKPEYNTQVACARYLSRMLMPGSFFTSVPAGGGGAKRGKHCKDLGYRAGTPDAFILHDGKFYGIEFKAPKKNAEPHQVAVAAEIIGAGGYVAVVRSIDDLQMVLKSWRIPTRLAVSAAA